MLRSLFRHNNTDMTGGKSSAASRPSVMVCLSPSPSSKRVIRTAARMAFSGMSNVVADVDNTETVSGSQASGEGLFFDEAGAGYAGQGKRTAGTDGAGHNTGRRTAGDSAHRTAGTDGAGRRAAGDSAHRAAGADGAGRRIAFAPDRPPIALYVGTTGREADEDSLLRENIQYARKYGFEVHTVQGTDIPLAIAEYARRVGVTDLFLGYSPPSFFVWTRPAINEKLLSYLPTVDIHIVPDPVSSPYAKTMKRKRPGAPAWNLRDLLLVLAVMAVATVLSYWFYMSRFSNSNIITIYILGVLIASVMTSSRLYGTLAAILYVLLFNFLFIEPRFTLLVYDSEYMMTYLVTVVAALITGTVAIRMKNIARASAENAYQAKVLLDTSNQLEGAADGNEIISTTCRQLVHLLNRAVVFYSPADVDSLIKGSPAEEPGEDAAEAAGTLDPETQAGRDAAKAAGGPLIFPAGEKSLSRKTLDKELEAVHWTLINSHNAGAFTTHFNDCVCRYLSVYSGQNQYGVIGIDMDGHPLTEFESTILLSIIHECTMALETKRMAQEQKKAEINAENERLRAGLLRSISHDLRTPLTSIYGNACNLRNYESDLPREDRDKIYDDIMEDADWLNAQFENILAMTRLESGLGIRKTIENMEDVIEQSLRYVTAHRSHRITFDTEGSEDQIFFAEMEPKLIMQVLVNLLNNAVKYTPSDSEIRVHLERSQDQIIVEVSDNGPGIDDEDKPYIFDLFYNGKKSLTDSYRSMGIGLNLCAQILSAHDGSIEVFDNAPTGAVFRFSLPAADLTSAEMDDE